MVGVTIVIFNVLKMERERQKNKEWLDCNGWEDLTDKDGNCYYKESTVLDILDKALKQVKNNDLLHDVSHTVIYDNFGRDWREPKEKYQIMEVLKDGYLIGNEDTKPFFAYEYQIKTCG